MRGFDQLREAPFQPGMPDCLVGNRSLGAVVEEADELQRAAIRFLRESFGDFKPEAVVTGDRHAPGADPSLPRRPSHLADRDARAASMRGAARTQARTVDLGNVSPYRVRKPRARSTKVVTNHVPATAASSDRVSGLFQRG